MAENAIKTEPGDQLGFNAPFVKHQRTQMRLTNTSQLKVMWALKSMNPHVLVQPGSGVLPPGQRKDIAVLCEALDKPPDSSTNHRLTVEWIECPANYGGGDKADFKMIESAAVVHRKVLKLEYNFS